MITDERLMLKVFRACIETGVFPTRNSPCHKKLLSILRKTRPKLKISTKLTKEERAKGRSENYWQNVY